MAAVGNNGPPNRAEFVTVKTTLPVRPFLPSAEKEHLVTERLIIRPLVQEDLAGYHSLRLQPEVMHFSSQGRADKDLAETQSRLDIFLPPKDTDTYNFALCLRETGEFIGTGGNHNFSSSLGWPEVGYMIRKEHWGKGLASEFLKAFVAAWAKLPREETELQVDARTVEGLQGVDGRVPEQLVAVTVITNARSQSVLRKVGFESCLTWDVPDHHNPNAMIQLPTFRFFPAGKTP
ncbi:acyl-CoA N-acyltransferase [Thozetella sp. PMI_491]|nr:acyl-CoA N-acyltransferase [Thozetella sp. PMI_491]